MRLDTFPDELRARAQNEVSLHALPDQMKLVRAEPHVGPRARYGVFLLADIVGHRAWILDLAHVGLTVKDSKRLLVGKRWGERCDRREGNRPREYPKIELHRHFSPDYAGCCI